MLVRFSGALYLGKCTSFGPLFFSALSAGRDSGRTVVEVMLVEAGRCFKDDKQCKDSVGR